MRKQYILRPSPHSRAGWKAAVRWAEGWEPQGLREIGGTRGDWPGGRQGTVMGNDRKGQHKTAGFRNVGEIPALHTGLSEGQDTHCWNELEWRTQAGVRRACGA